jgi:hypothetical protein
VPLAQAVQSIHHQAEELLPLEEHPLLKANAIGQAKAFQKWTTIQGHRFLQAMNGLGVRGRGQAAAQVLIEGQDIHPGVTVGVELDRLLENMQKRRGIIGATGWRAISNHGAQVGQGTPQIGASGAFRPVGPQQPGQLFAAMGPVGFYGQIG